MAAQKPDTTVLDRDAATTVLQGLKPLIKRIKSKKLELDLSVSDAMRIAEGFPTTGEELAEGAATSSDVDGASFVKAMVLQQLLASQLRPQQHEKSLRLPYAPVATVIYGPLHVDGDLTLQSDVFVLGDLKVSGMLESGVSTTCVAGKIVAGSISSTGRIWASGSISAKAVCQTHGFIFSGEGLRSELVLSGETHIIGEVQAPLIFGENFFDEGMPGIEKAEQELGKLLVPELDPRAIEAKNALRRVKAAIRLCAERIKAGKPYLIDSSNDTSSPAPSKPKKRAATKPSIAIEQAKAIRALDGLKPLLKRLPKDELTSSPNVAQAKALAKKLPGSVDELAGQLGEVDDLDGGYNFIQVLLSAAALESQPKPLSRTKNVSEAQEGGGPALVYGATKIGGNLSTSRDMIIFGDLEVAGNIDIWDPTTRIFVTQNVSCRGLSLSGSLWVGGNIDAIAVHAGLRSRLFADQLRASFVNEDSESYGIFAKVGADTHIKSAAWDKDPDAVLKRLGKILVPAALKGAEFSLPHEELMKLLAAKKPFLLDATNGASDSGTAKAKKKSTKPSGGKAQRLEFTSGSSKKFWEIRVRGSGYTVTFGRLGTEGQTKEKTLDSAAAAKAAADKLIKSKLSKGYKRAK